MLLTPEGVSPARRGGAPPADRRVLVVEDVPDARAALDSMLRRCGLQTACAASLSDALRLLGWQPHVIVLDLMLPDGSGVEVLRRVRNAKLPIRVGVITATSDPRLLDDVTSLKPEAFFQKPLDWQALCQWVMSQ